MDNAPATRLKYVLAENIRDRRGDLGWTQSDLAAAMRKEGFTTTRQQVAELETLRRSVSIEEWLGFALVLGVPGVALVVNVNDVRGARLNDGSPENPEPLTLNFPGLRDAIHGGSLSKIDDVAKLTARRELVQRQLKILETGAANQLANATEMYSEIAALDSQIRRALAKQKPRRKA